MHTKNRVKRLEMAIKSPDETTIIVRYGSEDEDADRKIRKYIEAGGDERDLIVINVIYEDTPIHAGEQ